MFMKPSHEDNSMSKQSEEVPLLHFGTSHIYMQYHWLTRLHSFIQKSSIWVLCSLKSTWTFDEQSQIYSVRQKEFWWRFCIFHAFQFTFYANLWMSNCFSFLYKMIILNTIFAGTVHTRLGFVSTNINTHDF